MSPMSKKILADTALQYKRSKVAESQVAQSTKEFN